ncbi:hypothetical protein Bbelb_171800 [Branchiostoma belcheri]|nr:hypothetical protein Bbelb_171800 [Branchiostoma belcheri]
MSGWNETSPSDPDQKTTASDIQTDSSSSPPPSDTKSVSSGNTGEATMSGWNEPKRPWDQTDYNPGTQKTARMVFGIGASASAGSAPRYIKRADSGSGSEGPGFYTSDQSLAINETSRK